MEREPRSGADLRFKFDLIIPISVLGQGKLKRRLCSQGSDETQEHLQLCEGTKFERRGLDLSDWIGLLDF